MIESPHLQVDRVDLLVHQDIQILIQLLLQPAEGFLLDGLASSLEISPFFWGRDTIEQESSCPVIHEDVFELRIPGVQ